MFTVSPPLRRVLLGPTQSRRHRYVSLGLIAGLFSATFLGYAVEIFTVAGGIVFIPGDAALVGGVGATYLGYQRAGLGVAWVGMYAALLGYRADHYLLSLSGRSLGERVGAFLQLDGFVVLGVEALVLGTLAFFLGVCCNWGIVALHEGVTDTETS